AYTSVYGCGLSASGALAIPRLVINENAVTAKEAHRPLRISHMNTRGIRHIAAGFGFSLFASKDKLYGSGLNNSHVRDPESKLQEYYISAKRVQLPIRCVTPSVHPFTEGSILSISSGRSHSLVATSEGVFAFGDNSFGQCGQDPEHSKEVHGLRDALLRAVEIPSDSPVVAVHCSLDSSFALTELGELFAFGLNEDGQCSNGSYGIQWRPSKVLGDAAGEKIVSISGSSDTITALSDKGEIFIWGQCEYGQALLGADSVQVYVWGVGLLGLGPALQKVDRPVLMDPPLFGKEKASFRCLMPIAHSKEDNLINKLLHNVLVRFIFLRLHPLQVAKVYAGNTSAGALTSNGRLYVWGQNRYGLLGLEHGKDQYFPFQIFFPSDVNHASFGPDHSLFLMR
ncbi:unnamed protein product, partial [Heligmosomoides polygyrus]